MTELEHTFHTLRVTAKSHSSLKSHGLLNYDKALKALVKASDGVLEKFKVHINSEIADNDPSVVALRKLIHHYVERRLENEMFDKTKVGTFLHSQGVLRDLHEIEGELAKLGVDPKLVGGFSDSIERLITAVQEDETLHDQKKHVDKRQAPSSKKLTHVLEGLALATPAPVKKLPVIDFEAAYDEMFEAVWANFSHLIEDAEKQGLVSAEAKKQCEQLVFQFTKRKLVEECLDESRVNVDSYHQHVISPTKLGSALQSQLKLNAGESWSFMESIDTVLTQAMKLSVSYDLQHARNWRDHAHQESDTWEMDVQSNRRQPSSLPDH